MEELEERIQQRMPKKFSAQKYNIERDFTMIIIVQLQHLNSGLTLDPNILRFNVRSPEEEVAIQLINHPSADRNSQGTGEVEYKLLPSGPADGTKKDAKGAAEPEVPFMENVCWKKFGLLNFI